MTADYEKTSRKN